MGAEAMEIDDIHGFLTSFKSALPDQLGEDVAEFADLYDRKLWHQLTNKLEEYAAKPKAADTLLPLFNRFVNTFQKKMNALRYVNLGVAASKCFKSEKGAQEAIVFLDALVEKVDVPESRDAYVRANMERAHHKLRLGDMEGTKSAMDECAKVLDNLPAVENQINASFYGVCADYYKAKADYAQFYKNALLYLACVSLDDLAQGDKVERAHDLSIAALLGDTIFNFGELLMHPVLDSLKATPHEYLRDLLFAFNAGDMTKFDAIAAKFDSKSLLQSNISFLRQKICLMALIETVFKRNASDRVLPFNVIATETRLPADEVEHLVMKALSLGLIKGSIDQVEGKVSVKWVQPRVLDIAQIQKLEHLIQMWTEKVDHTVMVVGREAPELFVS